MAMIAVGVLLFVWSSARRALYDAALMPEQFTQDFDAALSDQAKWPVALSVGQMINTSVEPGMILGDTWTVADTAATYLTQSAAPGEGGNVIVYGHNTPEVLSNLRALVGGEYIALRLSDGSEVRYQVSSVTEVEPDDIELLQPTEQEVLTVYTCSGFLDSKRFVVRAVPINNQ